jgi:potassium-dependent mechanosensitive channel
MILAERIRASPPGSARKGTGYTTAPPLAPPSNSERMKSKSLRPASPALLGLLLWVAATGMAGLAAAQTATGSVGVSIESLKGRIAAAQAREDLAPELKAQVIETYQNAVAALASADSLRTETENLRKIQAGAPETIQRLERELRALRAGTTSQTAPRNYASLSLDALERLENRLRTEVDQSRAQVADLQRQLDDILARPLAARVEQAELREEVASASTPGRETRQGEERAALAAAKRELARARQMVQQARLVRIDEELVAQPELARIAELRHSVAQAELDARSAEWKRVQALLETRQVAEIAKAREEAAQARKSGSGPADPVLELEARNRERRAQIAESSLATSRALTELADRKQQLTELEQTLRATKRRAATTAEASDLDKLLLGEINALPAPDKYRQAAARRASIVAQMADARLDVDLERAKIANFETAVADAMARVGSGVPAAQRAEIEQQVRLQITDLQRLLERLDKDLDVLLQTFRATDAAEASLLRRAEDVRDELVSLLFWIPVAPVGRQTFGNLGYAVEWLVAPANWRGVWETWQRTARRDPVLVTGAAILLIGLLAMRRWFKRKLPTLAPGAIPLHAFRMRYTVEALALTMLLALPAPFAMWTAGEMINSVHDAPLFAQATGVAFRLSAALLLFFRSVSWLFAPSGVAIKHFNWLADRTLRARRWLHGLMLSYVPLVFLAALGTAHAPEPVRQSLGRIAFVLAMAAVMVFWRRAFPPDQPIAALGRDESTIGLRLILAVVVRAPVWLGAALIVLSLAGFHFLAIYLHEMMLRTILLVFAAAIFYSLISVWLVAQRLRLAELEAQKTSEGQQAGPEGDAPAIRTQEIDADAIDAQTRQLLNMLMTVTLAVGIWFIWSPAFEAKHLDADLPLWSYVEVIDGKRVTHVISISGVLLAVAVGVIAYIATRNVGGMLDILLLKRVRLQADANYAIKTVARYLTAGLGIVTAANLLGISWTSVQWLVAALGVGLGFGLQEIVANFISGLIVLGERPIRIGDWVTVGDTSGTVTRIRARATVITDWENKEVLIPNKAFITERVINWTLSDQTTRLLLTVGVAYGTDPARAEKVLADVVHANPNVLPDPAPSVYFMGFGDSSLNFEIRAYVGTTKLRLRTTHDLNTAIAAALAKAGIEIPFPQRDIHIRTAEGLQGLMPGAPTNQTG